MNKTIELGDIVITPLNKMTGKVNSFHKDGRVGVNFCGCCNDSYYFKEEKLEIKSKRFNYDYKRRV